MKAVVSLNIAIRQVMYHHHSDIVELGPVKRSTIPVQVDSSYIHRRYTKYIRPDVVSDFLILIYTVWTFKLLQIF